MTLYKYHAVDGQGRVMRGEVEAESEAAAIRKLRSQSVTPVSLKEMSFGVREGQVVRRDAKMQDKVLFVGELSILLAAGVPLAEAIYSMGQSHTDTAVGAAAGEMYKILRSGGTLASAMRASSLVLPEYMLQLVSAGEMTGKLAEALKSAADRMEYDERIKQDMRNALIYPSVLIFSGVSAVLLIFIVVVPKFAGMLKNNRANVPEISVWVLEAGLFVKQHLLTFGVGALSILGMLVTALMQKGFRQRLSDCMSKVPVLGNWLIETEIGRWAGMLGTLLDSRVPIVQALELAQKGVQLTDFRQKLGLVVLDLRAGKSLADSLNTHRTISPTGINLVRVGERSGALSDTLQTLSRIYVDASKDRMKRLIILLEPITILIIGSVIGVIMVAIMLAITSLSNINL